MIWPIPRIVYASLRQRGDGSHHGLRVRSRSRHRTHSNAQHARHASLKLGVPLVENIFFLILNLSYSNFQTVLLCEK